MRLLELIRRSKKVVEPRRYVAKGGEVWLNVHDPSQCEGEFCCIHQPSQHVMINWPMHLRETGLVERMCQHGVGHPDPDSAAFFDRMLGHTPGTWSTHGCDGCCVNPYKELD